MLIKKIKTLFILLSVVLLGSVPVFASSLLVADFNSGSDPLNIGAGSSVGDVLNVWHTYVSTTAYGNTGYSLELNRSGGVGWITINFGATVDVSEYTALSFWVKGSVGDGTEFFSADLRNTEQNIDGGTEPGGHLRPRINDFLVASGDITAEWKKVVIPVASLMQTFVSTNTQTVNGIVFDFGEGPPPDETVYVDDIIFHKKCAPIWVNDYDGGSAEQNSFSHGTNFYDDGDKCKAKYIAFVSTEKWRGAYGIEMNFMVHDPSLWGVALEERFYDNAVGPPLDISGCDNIKLAMKRGIIDGATLPAKLEMWDDVTLCSTNVAITSSWQEYTIPFSDFLTIKSSMTKNIKIVWFGGNSTGTCYADEIRFVYDSSPTAPSSFLDDGGAVANGHVFLSTNVLTVTAQSGAARAHLENVRFEHDNLSGGSEWYLIGKDTDTSDGNYSAMWHTDSLQQGNTYQVRVVAEDISGNHAVLSPYTNCTVAPDDNTPPCAISNLTAIATNVQGSVRLTWTAPGDDGTNNNILAGAYKVNIATYYISGSNYSSISHNPQYTYSITFSTNITASSVQELAVTGLFPGATYFFAITTKDDLSNWSVWPGTAANLNSSSFAGAPDLLPNAVTSLEAAAGNTYVNLLWTKPDVTNNDYDDYAKYWVFMGTSSFAESQRRDPWISITTVTYNSLQNSATAQFAGLTNYTTYFFHISIFDQDTANGLFSVALESFSLVEISTAPYPVPPEQVSNFAGTVLSTGSIQWSWDNLIGETGYRVKNASAPSVSVSGDLSADQVTWVEDNLELNTAYGRAVAGFNGAGEGTLSDSATVYTLANAPAAPALDGVWQSSITVSWNKNSNPLWTRFGVNYSTTGYAVSVTTSTNFASNMTLSSSTLISLESSTTYYIEVWAYNENEVSTAKIQITTFTQSGPPSAPTGFAGTVLSTGSIRWSWVDVEYETGYRVKVASETSTNISGNLNQGATTWIEDGLALNKPFSRAVLGFNGFGEGDISSGATIYTLANAPASAVVSNVSNTSLTVSWGANSNPSGTRFGIYHSTISLVSVSTTTAVSYSDALTDVSKSITSLSAGVTYYISVVAYNGDAVVTGKTQVSAVTLSVVDTTAPAFVSATEYSEINVLNRAVKINAVISDNINISNTATKLYYKIDSGSYQSGITMTVVSDSTTVKSFTASIPASAVTKDGTISYYLTTADSSGNAAYFKSSVSPQVITVSQMFTSAAVSSGTLFLTDGDDEDGKTSIEIPRGALKDATQITIKQSDANSVAAGPASSKTSKPAAVYEFGPLGLQFRRPVTITLLYLDTDKDGIEDTLGVAVADLRIFWFDGVEWRFVGGTVNDYTSSNADKVNTVTVKISHFSTYAIFPVNAAEVTYRPKEKIITPALADGKNDTANFDGLSGADVTINIFDIQGRKIKSIDISSVGNIWAGTDENGDIVESGVYIYQFTFEGKMYSGTIVVAK